MYIVIAGGGIVGRGIIKALSKEHDVVVIDPVYENCEKISASYGVIVLHGDATNINTLREAGIEKADYALGVMSDDSKNLLFTILSKNFGVKNIFVRMRDPEYKDAYDLAGASNIGHSVDMIVNKFVLDIVKPDIRRVASLGGGRAEVSIIALQKPAKAVGMKIMDLVNLKGFPSDVVIAGMYHEASGRFVVMRGNDVLESDTQLFLVGSAKAIESAYKILLH